MNSRLLVLLLIATGLLSTRCSTNAALVGESGELYHSNRTLESRVRVYQSEERRAELHFDIETIGLLYKRDESGTSIADIFIAVESRSLGQAVNRVDTASFSVIDEGAGSSSRALRGYSMIPLLDTMDYVMNVRILDVNRGLEVSHKLFLYADEDNDRFYKVTPADGPADMFVVLRSDSMCSLQSPWLKGYELEVESYADDFPLPLPPFSLDTPAPYKGKKDTESSAYRNKEGSYAVQCPNDRICRYTDATTGKNVSLRHVSPAFPATQDIDGLIQVLRYISTRQEYDAMHNAEDKREAFEDFWLECAGSKERAKSLINEFHSRVREADASFSCHVDGWKTDRGIVHIIYGTPSSIIKEEAREVWYYGNKDDSTDLQMVFRRTANPFSDNDFRLERTLSYKSSWYIAMDAWRNGRIVDF